MGYDAGILNVEYQVKPKYEQYMQITTTNTNTNGQIIPFAVLGINIGNNPYTVNNSDNEPVTFRLSEITEIKLFNTYSFYNNRIVNFGNGITNNFGAIVSNNNAALKNLVKVDLTECTFLEELPSNFFSGIPSLKTVISNGNTKKLQQVGSNFLADSENIEFIDLDFSALTRTGNYFLMNSLINYKNTLVAVHKWKKKHEFFDANRVVLNPNKVQTDFEYIIICQKTSNAKLGKIMQPHIENGTLKEKMSDVPEVFDCFGTTSSAKDEIKELFGQRDYFSTPKPLKLMKELIRATTSPNSIVLDFFAGSGTVGHACLELNAEDGGQRNFILISNNESNICEDVTNERLYKATMVV